MPYLTFITSSNTGAIDIFQLPRKEIEPHSAYISYPGPQALIFYL